MILILLGFMLVKIDYVYLHLKDLGELTINWTRSLEEEIVNRIVGGTPTSLEEYPYNVKFFNFGGVCGGVIMSSKTVLTAAHCFDYNWNIGEMKIISSSERTYHHSANHHNIWDFIIHENYNRTASFANDIAVIIIHNSFKFGPKVQAAVLTDNNSWMNEDEDEFIATGWGTHKVHHRRLMVINQQKFMKTHLQYVSNEKCMAMNKLYLTADMFCLYGNGVRDTCKGDSGGGILWKKIKVKREPEGKIVGGKPADLKRIPHAAKFYNDEHLCGAVVLNSWSLLTSAHCFYHNGNVDLMAVIVGSRFLNDVRADSHNVMSFVTHEKHNVSAMFACDIALLFLMEPIKFGDNVKKALLVPHNKWMTNKEKNFTVAGWGMTTYGSPSSPVLLMTTLSYVSKSDCERLHNIQLTDDMFCLYGSGERDTCKGDSGGGVIWKGFVVGLTSHGNGCAVKGKPTVYANVWYFHDWIKAQVIKFVKTNCDAIII